MIAARNERQNPSSERSKQNSPPRSPRAKRQVPASASRTSTHAVLPIRGRRSRARERSGRSRSRGEVGHADAFVDLMRGLPDEAEFGDRATSPDEAGVGGAAGGAEFGRPSGDPADRFGEPLADRPGWHQKRFAADRDIELVTPADPVEPL